MMDIIRRKKLGKKAFIAGALVDLYAYLMFVVVVILFYMIFKITATVHTEEMRGSADMISGNVYATTYVRVPMEIEGHQMTMSDLIRLADENEDYEDLFEERTEWYLETTTDKDLCFYFRVKGKNEGAKLDYEEAESGCAFTMADFHMDEYVGNSNIPFKRFKTIIPSFDDNSSITVYMFYDVDTLRNAYGVQNPYLEYARFAAPLGPAGTLIATAAGVISEIQYGSPE